MHHFPFNGSNQPRHQSSRKTNRIAARFGRAQALTCCAMAALLSFASVLPGCGEDTPPGRRPVTINFAGSVGNAFASCNTLYPAVGTSLSSIRLKDFRFYVSNVRLVDETGRIYPVTLDADGLWQDGNLALVDLEDGSGSCNEATTADVHTAITGTTDAPESTVGIYFDLGVPFAQNHQAVATAPAPLNQPAMFWSWQKGFKFLRLDLQTAGDSAMTWRVHLGSTRCQSASEVSAPTTECASPNRAQVFLPFIPQTQTIVADIGALLGGSDLSVNNPPAPGCMSDPSLDSDCGPVFAALGLDPANGTCVQQCQAQTFFRAQ